MNHEVAKTVLEAIEKVLPVKEVEFVKNLIAKNESLEKGKVELEKEVDNLEDHARYGAESLKLLKKENEQLKKDLAALPDMLKLQKELEKKERDQKVFELQTQVNSERRMVDTLSFALQTLCKSPHTRRVTQEFEPHSDRYLPQKKKKTTVEDTLLREEGDVDEYC